MPSEGRYFFASDVHVGAACDPDNLSEKQFVSFLESLPDDTAGLYLLGDIFDFRVEYRDVVPKGGIRVLGALAALADRGVEIHYICGNHDWWLTDYLEKEIGAEIIREKYVVREAGGMKLCLGHGDGLGERPFHERVIFGLFRSKVCISLLKALPPRWVFSFARAWSASSRKRHSGYVFQGAGDSLYKFAEGFGTDVDAFIFGHLHTPVETRLPDGTPFFILGDWSSGPSFLNLSGMYISGGSLPNMEK